MPNDIGGNWSTDVSHDGYIILYVDWIEQSEQAGPVPRKIAIAVEVNEGDTAHQVRDRVLEQWNLAETNGLTATEVGSEEFKLSGFPQAETLSVVDVGGDIRTLEVGGDPVETYVGGLTLQRTEV